MEWYSFELSELEEKANCSLSNGLSEKKVRKLQNKYGPNVLKQAKKVSIFKLFFYQLKDFMILTLFAAAAISFFASYSEGIVDFTEPGIILAIVFINAMIGVYQERKAEHSLEALRSLQTPESTVLREGKKKKIPSDELVPGDIVFLTSGCFVPADGRLISAFNLTVNESALTGETEEIEKNTNAIRTGNHSLGDYYNMVFSGTTVSKGRGSFLVTATGMDTEIGTIAGMLAQEKAPETPLTKRLNHTGQLLGFGALIICVIVFILGIQKEQPVFSMFMTSVSLGVAAIPESLPALVTIMLSLGVEKMAKQNAVIRHLPAVETLGSASVICSDKTGTLTENRMTVRKVSILADQNFFYRLMVLCNDQSGPLEEAMTAYADKNKVSFTKENKNCPRIYEISFDSKRKKMTTVHRTSDGFLSVTKGAPEIILADCSYFESKGEIHSMTQEKRREIQQEANDFASHALRVISIAYQKKNCNPAQLSDSALESGLVFAGLIGVMDPPRKEAETAVKNCKAAGILPIMITGDHPLTAAAIGKELGICQRDSEVMTGREIDVLTDNELSKMLPYHRVFARVSPAHKVRLVRQFQRQGNTVAMTGDGVNDAPALKAADIGCAMGISGTDVAKSASDMILLDDNFSTIVSAVREGRGIFDNIKKAIHFLLSCNIGEIMTIFAAILFGLDVPLLPVQLLFINLVTDSIPALCLGVEPPDKNIMKRPPIKSGKSMFSFQSSFSMIVEGMFIGSLALFAYTAGNSTICFCVLSLSQLVHSFNMRSSRSLLSIGFFSNKKLLFCVLLCIILQCFVVTFPPMQAVFHTTTLTFWQWGFIAVLSLLPIPLVELEKRIP